MRPLSVLIIVSSLSVSSLFAQEAATTGPKPDRVQLIARND